MPSQNFNLGGRGSMKMSLPVEDFGMSFCRMEARTLGFPFIVENHTCGSEVLGEIENLTKFVCSDWDNQGLLATEMSL